MSCKDVDSLWSESTPQKKSKSSMQPKKQRKNYQKYSQQFLEAARRTLDKNTNEGHLPHEAYALFFVCSRSFHPQLVFVLVNVCVCVWLLLKIAGSIHPPVTTEHGDEVMFNSLYSGMGDCLGSSWAAMGRGGGPVGESFRVRERPK
jgi:hypothetical protein